VCILALTFLSRSHSSGDGGQDRSLLVGTINTLLLLVATMAPLLTGTIKLLVGIIIASLLVAIIGALCRGAFGWTCGSLTSCAALAESSASKYLRATGGAIIGS